MAIIKIKKDAFTELKRSFRKIYGSIPELNLSINKDNIRFYGISYENNLAINISMRDGIDIEGFERKLKHCINLNCVNTVFARFKGEIIIEIQDKDITVSNYKKSFTFPAVKLRNSKDIPELKNGVNWNLSKILPNTCCTLFNEGLVCIQKRFNHLIQESYFSPIALK